MNIPDSNFRYASTFDALTRWLNLQDAYDYFLINNQSAMLPYHNLQHMKFVVEDSLMLIGPKDLGHNAYRGLAVAAMFHDFKHTGNGADDELNVARACEGVRNFLGKSIEAVKAERLITTTSFIDGRFPYEPGESREAQALRDADLCSVFHVYQPEGRSLMRGLFEEINIGKTLLGKETLGLPDFVRETYTFLRDATFYTDVGQHLQQYELKNAIKTLWSVMCPHRAVVPDYIFKP